MKKPFAVGEKVRVYSHYGPYIGTIVAVNYECSDFRGEKINRMLLVQNSQGTNWPQHPKQVRRLKKKEKLHKINLTTQEVDDVWSALACFKQALFASKDNPETLQAVEKLIEKFKNIRFPEGK